MNRRVGMTLLAGVGASVQAIAGADAFISLQPASLHDEHSELDTSAIQPIDTSLTTLDLTRTLEPESSVYVPTEFERQVSTLELRHTAPRWGASDSLFSEDDALARVIEIEDTTPLELGPSVRLHFERPTPLRDGGIGGSQSSLSNTPSEDRIYGFENAQGQFDLYDISLRWNTFSTGPVSFALIGGVKAVSTDVTERVAEYDERGAQVSTRAEDEYRMVPVPIVGGSFRWDVGERFYLVGTAQTHTIPDGNTLLDLTAETGIDFSPTVGLRAGYTYVRTAVELEKFDARLTQSGVFARVQIRF